MGTPNKASDKLQNKEMTPLPLIAVSYNDSAWKQWFATKRYASVTTMVLNLVVRKKARSFEF